MLAAELEIRISGLAGADPPEYQVQLEYHAAGSFAAIEHDPVPAALDLEALEEARKQEDVETYSGLLTEGLFADEGARTFFACACATAWSVESALRVRVAFEASAARLHGLRWELLRDPLTKQPLTSGERVWFSRYLNSPNWNAVVVRSKEKLTALIAVANPSGLGTGYRELDPIDVDAEIARARERLARAEIVPDIVRGPTTFSQLEDRLHDEYDVLYLVCHGTLMEESGRWVPYLWLEGAEVVGTGQGEVARTPGEALVELLAGLGRRPRLVVLASCQSGNNEDVPLADGAPQAALGPRLAEAGVPAVLAMQGKVKVSTVAAFMPVFFRELARDGRIDRAVGAARGAARRAFSSDAWMPVLFSRLDTNALWNTGFATAGESEGFDAWNKLLERIEQGQCTPVLGPGLVKDLFGTARQLARQWALSDQADPFPLESHGRNELTQVCQFLSGQSGARLPYDMLREYQLNQVVNRYAALLPGPLRTAKAAELEEVLREVGICRRRSEESEPHRILARLDLPLYLSANPDDFLTDALREVGREPRVGVCPWHSRRQQAWTDDPPSVESPVVYHLLGRIDDFRSLVLTEDDYIRYLISVARLRKEVPHAVRKALTETVLLFLGFQVEHWTFRALLRGLLALSDSQPGYAPVAVQVDPDENDFLDMTKARRYLAKAYPFGESAMQVYWGTARDFLEQLDERWQIRHPQAAAGAGVDT
jgi:hypothetical protein